jgi:hypothetical protein
VRPPDASGEARRAGAVRRYVDRFAAAGCDELVLLPCDPDPAQVDLLTDALVARRAPQ